MLLFIFGCVLIILISKAVTNSNEKKDNEKKGE